MMQQKCYNKFTEYAFNVKVFNERGNPELAPHCISA